MTIGYPPRITTGRARILIEQVLRPAQFTDEQLLEVGVFQCDEPITYDEAIRQDFTPASLGFVWGPVWSTAWFRLRGRVPESFTGDFRLRFDTRTEAVCWWDGSPYHGVELHRQDVKLPASIRPGDAFEIFVEAACNHMSGVGAKYSDPPRSGEFPITQSGKLTLAHLSRYHPERAAALLDLETLAGLADTLPEQSSDQRHAAEALRQACVAFDASDIDGCLPAVRAFCKEGLTGGAGVARNEAMCVGNTHIDLAWLWPIRETKRKASRSFSTVLRYMEQHENYTFIQSQPQLYEWVRQSYPGLFKQIQQRVAEGRWEAAGGMWVEADCNIPSGESLTRQMIHGIGFFKEHFDREHNFLWLPDVFGYSAALPQIMKGCGLDAIVTQKISWNQFNKFPHTSFNWTGIDGTTIVAHFPPSESYINQNVPADFARGEKFHVQAGEMPVWLQAYGWGDGGGGPTEASIERIDRLGDAVGMPRTSHSFVQPFVDRLIEASDKLPHWTGELYLELHRGTYTSQAALKRGNRQGEVKLKQAELAQALLGLDDSQRQTMDRLWKGLLLNQFHDIIPGSSIEWVNREARALYDEVSSEADRLLDEAVAGVTGGEGPTDTLLVLNSRSHGRGGLLTLPAGLKLEGVGTATQAAADLDGGDGGTLVSIPDSTGPGVTAYDAASLGAPGGELKVEDGLLENRHLRVELDEVGRVTRLLHKATGREAVEAEQPANQLVLYDDRPIDWDAWDLEVYYRETPRPITAAATSRIVEQGPPRVAIEFTHQIGRSSTLTQHIQLGIDDHTVTFDTRVDWREERTVLRVLHPVAVVNDSAAFEIQYGFVRRPTHFNTSWDYARFESVAHRWVDLSEPGFGVSLLNDCKYGHSCHGSTLGISLLRSPREPDPTADVGVHRFRYGLEPHGDFDAAAATLSGEAFNEPLRGWPVAGAVNSLLPQPLATLAGPHAAATCIESIKPAQDGQGIIIRLREARGGRGSVTLQLPKASKVQEVDLLERPLPDVDAVTADRVEAKMTPFKLRTFRVNG